MRSHLSGVLFLAVAAAAFSLWCGSSVISGQSRETWSAWRSTDGEGRIQFRWRTYGGDDGTLPKCDYQIRNLSSSDAETYDSTVDYIDSRGRDDTTSGPFLNKTYNENRGGITGCTKVTDVMTKLRRR